MSKIKLDIEKDIPLASFTTFKVGGKADYLVRAKNNETLLQAVTWAKENNLPITIVGGGSNVLIADQGVRGLVILIESLGISVEEEKDKILVTAQAGESLDDLIAYSVERGWWGLENLSAIPGSVGAAPIQNVGAYGVEVGDCITAVQVLDMDNMSTVFLPASECQFGYRDSLFKTPAGRKYIVLAVTFVLSREAKPNLNYRDLAEYFPKGTANQAAIRDAVIEIRSNKFPDWKILGTAGSFFKNPIIKKSAYEKLLIDYHDLPGFSLEEDLVKVPLGYILDKICHFKGVRQGQVGTYSKQALVIVNHGGATALEMKDFAATITQLVKEKTNIEIESEVTMLN